MTVIKELLITLVLAFSLLLITDAFAKDESDEMVDNIANFRFDLLGHPQIQSDSIKPVLATVERPHKLLIIPVRFPDLGYDRFAGEANQNEQNNAWFQQLLFAGGVQGALAGCSLRGFSLWPHRPLRWRSWSRCCRRSRRSRFPSPHGSSSAGRSWEPTFAL